MIAERSSSLSHCTRYPGPGVLPVRGTLESSLPVPDSTPAGTRVLSAEAKSAHTVTRRLSFQSAPVSLPVRLSFHPRIPTPVSLHRCQCQAKLVVPTQANHHDH
eukprot:611933-Rhodomonas_salina.1